MSARSRDDKPVSGISGKMIPRRQTAVSQVMGGSSLVVQRWYPCLGNPMDRGARQAAVHGGLQKCWTLLLRLNNNKVMGEPELGTGKQKCVKGRG